MNGCHVFCCTFSGFVVWEDRWLKDDGQGRGEGEDLLFSSWPLGTFGHDYCEVMLSWRLSSLKPATSSTVLSGFILLGRIAPEKVLILIATHNKCRMPDWGFTFVQWVLQESIEVLSKIGNMPTCKAGFFKAPSKNVLCRLRYAALISTGQIHAYGSLTGRIWLSACLIQF